MDPNYGHPLDRGPKKGVQNDGLDDAYLVSRLSYAANPEHVSPHPEVRKGIKGMHGVITTHTMHIITYIPPTE